MIRTNLKTYTRQFLLYFFFIPAKHLRINDKWKITKTK